MQPSSSSSVSPSSGAPSPGGRRWFVIAFVAGIVAVGAWVGTTAGRLAHRAPRATGTRVAVLPFTSTVENAPGLEHVVAAELERSLARVFAARGDGLFHVVPIAVVASKVVMMERGGVTGSFPGAAAVLDVDQVITGSIAPQGDALRLHLEFGPPGGPSTTRDLDIAGEDPLGEMAGALLPFFETLGLKLDHVPGVGTTDVRAFAADVHGDVFFRAGDLRGAADRFSDAVTADGAFADAAAHQALALALVRDRTPSDGVAQANAVRLALARRDTLSPLEAHLVQGLEAWLRWEAAAVEERAAVAEDVFRAFRAATVEFPEERLGHLFLGRAYVQLMNGSTEALRHFEAARRLSPEWFPTVAELVDAWLKLGDRKHAAAEVRGYLVVKKDDEAARQLLQAIGE